MELIIEFYQNLDTLNLIIFWGIITVIVLLFIFSIIMINKNNKLKTLVEKSNKEEKLSIKEELPIKNDNLTEEQKQEFPEEEKEIILPQIASVPASKEVIDKPIEIEKKFVAEEHVMEYNKELFTLPNIKKTSEEEKIQRTPYKNNIEIPNKPYQRNVLREMSLSQTSPIGINRQVSKEDEKIKLAKDLEESLNNEKNKEIEETIKEEFHNIENENSSIRKTEIRTTPSTTNYKTENNEQNYPKKEIELSQNNRFENKEINQEINNQHLYIKDNERSQNKEYINNKPKRLEEKKISENYLEEVSRKLAEAEMPDDIERTKYELEQEENAIISYKELMEKKDSIQTIDEEEVVISIEELMNKNNRQKEQEENDKLYKLSEEEENENFIEELKKFRNDLE